MQTMREIFESFDNKIIVQSFRYAVLLKLRFVTYKKNKKIKIILRFVALLINMLVLLVFSLKRVLIIVVL